MVPQLIHCDALLSSFVWQYNAVCKQIFLPCYARNKLLRKHCQQLLIVSLAKPCLWKWNKIIIVRLENIFLTVSCFCWEEASANFSLFYFFKNAISASFSQIWMNLPMTHTNFFYLLFYVQDTRLLVYRVRGTSICVLQWGAQLYSAHILPFFPYSVIEARLPVQQAERSRDILQCIYQGISRN